MNDLFFKSCGDCSAGHSGKEESRDKSIILFSHDKDPFDGINKLDVQDTTLESFYFYHIDDSKRHCQSYQHRNRLKFPRVN